MNIESTMKTFLLVNKKGEVIERKGFTEQDVRHWAIAHLDLSEKWSIHLKG
jgi:hypothetical protein